MSVQTFYQWQMHGLGTGAGTGVTSAINSANTWLAGVYVANKSGDITSVRFRVPTVTGVSPTYQLRIETVVNGNPSGTLMTPGASQTFTAIANTIQTVTLPTPASVNAGQPYAVVIRHSSGTIDVSNSITIQVQNVNYSWINGTFESGATSSINAGVSWGGRSADAASSIVPYYADGTAEWGLAPFYSNLNFSLSTSNRTHVGCRFVAPISCDLVGCNSLAAASAAHVPFLEVYDDAMTTTLHSQPIYTTSNAGVNTFMLTTPVAITQGVAYRIGLRAVNNTNPLVVPTRICLDTASRRACIGDSHSFDVSSGSGFINDDTTAIPFIAPIFANPGSMTGGGGGGGSSSARQVNIRGGADQ